VTVDYVTRDSRIGPDGALDHVVIRVELMHHVSEKRKDLRAFTVYTEFGMEHKLACALRTR